MIKINIRPLPNARIPYDDAKDPALRKKVMLLNDNIVSLSTQLTEAQKAVIELQKRKVVPTGIDDLEKYVAQAKASAEAAAQALADCGIAKDAAEQAVADARTEKQGAIDAKDAAVSAKGGAEQAKTDAETARGEAVEAKNGAASERGTAVAAKDLAVAAKDIAIAKAQEAGDAASRAERAVGLARWTPLAHNQAFANNTAATSSFIPMSLFVTDNSKTYDVEVRFVYWYRYTPKITSTVRHFLVGEYTINQTTGVQTEVKFARSSVTPSTAAPIVTGHVETLTLENVSPASCLAFINGSTTSITDASHAAAGVAQWDVYIYIKEHQAA